MKKRGQSKAKKILIVDDEEDIARLVADFIREMGFEVASANDGWEALSIIESFKPDIVVSDIHMPKIDGDELYRRKVAATPSYSKRFIFMTGSGIDLEMSRFLRSTGCVVLTKPFEFQELADVIEKKVEEMQRDEITGKS